MDRFLKRSAPTSSSAYSSSPVKKPALASKQGSVSASVRVAEFGKHTFYADDGKLFCKCCNAVVDHVRKNTVYRHIKSKVLYRYNYIIL